jgi:putative peptidoglycan lipid II flippase
MVKDTWPLFAGTIITCGLPFVDTVMAGHLEPGDVSVLTYSDKICSIFFAVLATSVGTALFPFLADLAAKSRWQELKQKLHHYAFWISLASLPIVGLLYLLAPWLVELLFHRGAFGAQDVERVALVLRCHAVQIPFYVIAVLTSHVVMALRAGKYMLFTTVVNLSLNIGLNVLFIRWLGLAGIPLATAAVYVVSGLMLYVFVRREISRRSLALLSLTPQS